MAKSRCPRLIFIRHGQTEWSKSGQYTSRTDLPLTEYGVRQMRATGRILIGYGGNNLVKPAELKLVISSPRKRALETRDLLLESLPESQKMGIREEIDPDIREWEYGRYEGLTTEQIKADRKKKGYKDADNWTIWKCGCENGEDADQVTERVDRLIAKVRKLHKKAIDDDEYCDILVVGHGHILRCLAARWVGRRIDCNPQFMLDAGGVGVLSYQHHNIEEPAIYLTGAFLVPVEEEGHGL
ncbi:DEKNAAC104992 [Brettanomyces naardenensis]|uniref:DEKNAAC104992 n=1 Tax=Brettanomyces naardenensis TaxID=13370 RepID=A0A448YSC5_BRENA|nr:DEKNAAC104992 [Brettanomyces naardenensis]